MLKRQLIVPIATLIISQLCFGLEFNKQQNYNANNDFLLHEGGTQNNAKISNGASSQTNAPNINNQNNSPRKPTQQTSGKRDYVAQFPPLSTRTPASSTPTTTKPNLSSSSVATVKPPSSGKRDYVNPQFPALPTQPPGKVQGLVSYFDNFNNKNQNSPQNTPSYSSILQGSGGNKNHLSTGTTSFISQQSSHTTLKPLLTPTKPMSFSSVVAGGNKPTAVATPKPTSGTRTPTVSSNSLPSPTPRPSSPVLPSSIVNNNRNNNNRVNNNSPTDDELQIMSEELLRKDTNNAAKYITINYQEKTTSQSKEDKAPLPLLTIGPQVWNISTIQKFVPLLDNYERDTLINEYVTPQERNEENTFMDAIMTTSVIRHLMTFLKDRGYVTPDPRQQRDFLKNLWFNLYSRGKGKISSSGFEHVFVSELKNGEVSGLHNWIYFYKEETANRANYLGYLKYAELNDKGSVLKLHFNQQGVDKPVDSMFIGTSPELEMSLYTLCFVTRADNDCKLKLGTKEVNIVTHTYRYRSKNLIGSAYPQI